MKKFLMYGALAFLCIGVSACHSDDPDAVATPPVVEKAPNAVTGVVTDMQGNPVEGAVVKVGSQSVTTDANGVYVLSGLDAGEHAVTVSGNGLVTRESTINVPSGDVTKNITYSPALANAGNVESVNVTVANGGQGEVESEAIRGNDKGEIEIAIDVPANTVPANTNISITPLYDASDAGARSVEESMLVGATIACSDASLRLSQPINLSFAVDATVSGAVVTKKYENGRWVTVQHEVRDGNVIIAAQDFTSYGLFFTVDVNVASGREPLTFARSEWNNINGSELMYVGEATFGYKLGMEFSFKAANNIEGLMIELLARRYGATYVTAQGSYPINTILYPGIALSVSGYQAYGFVTARANGRTVTAKQYGMVEVTVLTYNRDHEGGSNVPNKV